MRRAWLIAAAALAASGCGGAHSEPGQLTSLSTQPGAAAQSHQRTAHGGKKTDSVRTNASAAPVAAGTAGRSGFVRRADAICRQTHTQIGAVGRQVAALVERVRAKSLSIPEYYRRSADLTLASARIALRSVEHLRALPRPAGDRRLAAYLASSAAQARLLEDQASALRSRDARRAAAINGKLARAAARSHALVRGYGFKSCAGGD